MALIEVDMEGPDPIHEAAYSQIVKTVIAYKRQVDSMLANPQGLVATLSLPEIKKRKEFRTVSQMWERDEDFRVYLRKALGTKFGNEYAKRLLNLFVN